MKKYETIYSYFKNHSKEEVDSSLERLSEEERGLLHQRFSNLPWDNKNNRRFYYIIYKLKNMLKNKNTCYSNGKRVTTIYQRLSNYSKEEIDYIINLLPKKDRYLLYLRYGSDLNNPDTSNCDSKYKFQFESLIDKIKIQLDNRRLGKEIVIKQGKNLTIYQIFKEYSKDEVDEVLNNLNEYDKYLLYLRYGKDLENIDTSNWDSKYNIEFYKKLIPKIRNRLRSNKIKNNEVIDINPKVKINPILERKIIDINNNLLVDGNVLLENFSKEEVLIYILVQKMDDSYNINDLVNYFKVDRKYILKIVKNILESIIPTKCLIKR